MAPFGGIKDSGYGKEAGIESIKDYTRIKTTWYNSSNQTNVRPFYYGLITSSLVKECFALGNLFF